MSLLDIKEPWIYRFHGDVTKTTIIMKWKEKYPQGNIYQLDGQKMMLHKAYGNELRTIFAFPSYYTGYANSLNDCLRDEDILVGEAFLVIIKNGDHVLIKEDNSFLESFLDSLKYAAEYWSESINLGESWDRPSKSFHSIFEFDKLNLSRPMLMNLPLLTN